MFHQLLLCFFFVLSNSKFNFLKPSSLRLLQHHDSKDSRIEATQLPLFVKGRYIVDSNGNRAKLACVNWYGAEELDYVVGGLQWNSIANISSLIASYGFNCIRLPFSLELIDKNPVIQTSKIASEPSLYNHRALDVLDAVINTLTNTYHIMVILDNHMSDANWCCSGSDGNGLWYTNNYPESSWLNLWSNLIERYKNNPYIIGVDLRNELRSTTVNGKNLNPTWGNNNNATDWRLAAIKCANILQSINPNLLIIVEGINYAIDLTGIKSHPILDNDLKIGKKLLYSAHDYSWDHSDASYNALSNALNNNWGYIMLNSSANYYAPVWLGEFGECHDNTNSCLQSTWWQSIIQYLKNMDNSWGYWAVDGTQSTGSGRTYGNEETFGILNITWNGAASNVLVQNLQSVSKPTTNI